MARRRKSLNDLWDQYERIRQGGNNVRTDKAFNIATRYGKNIMGTQAWKNAFAQGKSQYKANNPDERIYRDFEANAKTAGYAKADDTKVSRAQYMGQAGSKG